MKRKILPLISIVFSVLSFTSLKAQWVGATQNPVYLAEDMGFFQSKTGISLNIDTAYHADVRRTTNGGQSWTSVNMSNFKNAFASLSTINTTIGFAAGYQLIKTTDGGATWDSVSNISFSGMSRSQVVIEKIAFASETVGFAMLDNGNNVIYKTTDGGKTWSEMDTIPGLTMVYVLDANDVYTFANGGMVYSNDGGSTWKTTPSTTFGNINLYNVLFLSASSGYVTGADGNLFHTTDGGATWSKTILDTQVNLLGIQFLDANNAIISAAVDITFSSTDGGTSWRHHFEPDPNSFFLYDLDKAYFFDKNNGAAMGRAGILDELLYNSYLSSGIEEASDNKVNLSIYPNPSTGLVNISTDGLIGNGILTVFNSAGKVVFKGNVEGDSHQALSLSNYGKGLYTIEVATENTVGHQQVIIE